MARRMNPPIMRGGARLPRGRKAPAKVLHNLIYRGPSTPIANQTAPTISGTSYNGQTLTTTNGTWNPTPDNFAYQWYSNSNPISGATANTYVVTATTEGTQIYCKVTANKSGFISSSEDSNILHHFIPTDISLQAWYDPADASTITEVSGSVSQWNDKSGRNNHAVQGVFNSQPRTGLTINGLNVLFGSSSPGETWMNVGSADLIKSCFAMVNVSDPPISSARVLVLGSKDSSRNGPEVFVRYDTPQISFDGVGTNTGKASLDGGADSTVDVDITEVGLQTDYHILELVSTNTFVLGTILGRGDDPAVGPAVDYEWGDIIWVDTELSTATKQKMEGYLAHKWGRLASLPGAHPYKTNPPTP